MGGVGTKIFTGSSSSSLSSFRSQSPRASPYAPSRPRAGELPALRGTKRAQQGELLGSRTRPAGGSGTPKSRPRPAGKSSGGCAEKRQPPPPSSHAPAALAGGPRRRGRRPRRPRRPRHLLRQRVRQCGHDGAALLVRPYQHLDQPWLLPHKGVGDLPELRAAGEALKALAGVERVPDLALPVLVGHDEPRPAGALVRDAPAALAHDVDLQRRQGGAGWEPGRDWGQPWERSGR